MRDLEKISVPFLLSHSYPNCQIMISVNENNIDSCVLKDYQLAYIMCSRRSFIAADITKSLCHTIIVRNSKEMISYHLSYLVVTYSKTWIFLILVINCSIENTWWGKRPPGMKLKSNSSSCCVLPWISFSSCCSSLGLKSNYRSVSVVLPGSCSSLSSSLGFVSVSPSYELTSVLSSLALIIVSSLSKQRHTADL